MKNTLYLGLMAVALGFTACSEDNEAIFNKKTQKGMTLNATVVESADTRANIDNSAAVWPFTFAAGDEVKVTNDLESGTSYTFKNGATSFSCIEATPTSEVTTWRAHYPKGDIDLTNQQGTIEYVASIYALSGATDTPTTGESGLNINLTSSMSILKVINGGGPIDIKIKTGTTKWVKGMAQTAEGFEVTTSETAVSLFKTEAAGDYYVAIPAGMEVAVKDGDIFLEGNYNGYTAGKYYSLTVNEAIWSYSFPGSMDKTPITKIVIEINASSTKPSGAYDLNMAGDVWYVVDGSTLRVQSPRPKIKLAAGNYPSNNLFDWFKNVTDISGLANIDTRDVTEMNYMFSHCSSLLTLDVSTFKTEKVTNMHSMFSGCKSLPTLNLSTFNTGKVTDMAYMFSDCESLSTINVSSFDTKNVTDMHSMFEGCKSLPTLDVSTFNTEKVTDMAYMFSNCESLPTINVSSFDTKNVTDMHSMFNYCKGLTSLDLSNFNTANVTNIQAMFQYCIVLPSLDLRSFNTTNVTNMSYVFNGCDKLSELDLSTFNLSSAEKINNMFDMCYEMSSLKLSNNFTIHTVPNRKSLFEKCGKDVTDKGIIYGVTNTDIITASKYNGTPFTPEDTGWTHVGTNMKFDGE